MRLQWKTSLLPLSLTYVPTSQKQQMQTEIRYEEAKDTEIQQTTTLVIEEHKKWHQ
jgi:hypothetical protein